VNEDTRPLKEAVVALSELAQSHAGPPAGFGKGVNDYLNHYVAVTDAKARSYAPILGDTLLSLC
jgi:hypothetical protein